MAAGTSGPADMYEVLTTSGAVLVKAGSGVSSVVAESGAIVTELIQQAEGWINMVTRFNWIDEFPTLNEDVKHMLTEAASNLAAAYLINYDMSGYTSRTEAEIMINLLILRADEILGILIDKKQETFVRGA